jgi:hypothetical protein
VTGSEETHKRKELSELYTFALVTGVTSHWRAVSAGKQLSHLHLQHLGAIWVVCTGIVGALALYLYEDICYAGRLNRADVLTELRV